MGNELLTAQAAGNVNTGLSTNFANTSTISTPNIANPMGSLFSLPPCGKDYSNDIMMPDFLKMDYTNYTYPQNYQNQSVFNQTQTQSPVQNPAFAGTAEQIQTQPQAQDQAQNQYSQEELAQYYNYLNQKQAEEQPAQQENIKENSGKKTGLIIGILAPIATGIAKVFKGGSAAKALSLKSLAVKIPVLALAGWCVGSLIDTISGKKYSIQQA